MAKRTSQTAVMVEYTPADVVRTSQAAVMVEYTPADVVRTSQAIVMVEYAAFTGRVVGPAAQSM